MQNYRRQSNDRRDFVRIEIDSEITYRIRNSPRIYGGQAKNLSGNGIGFETEDEIRTDTIIEVSLRTRASDKIPPLNIEAQVVRCDRIENQEAYFIGAAIIKTL